MKKNLIGFTGNRVGYNSPGDNNWSQNINYAIKTIAANLDKFEYGINDVARETEAAAGRRFQELQDALTEFVNTYIAKISSSEDIAYANLKQYIDDRLKTVAEAFITSSQNDLNTTIAVKEMIENQIIYINTGIKYLKRDFDYNLNLFNAKIATAKSQRDAVVAGLTTSVNNAETILKNHIANKANPHRTKLARLASAATVYQLDKDNSTSLIEPAFIAKARKVTIPADDADDIIDTVLDFTGKVLGLGDYAERMDSGLLGGHFYLNFHPTLFTLTDSSGDTAVYEDKGHLLSIVWDIGSSKEGLIWEIAYPNTLERLAPITLTVKSAISLLVQQNVSGPAFVLYFSDDIYPNLIALFLGMVDKRIYVGNETDSINDTDFNWTADITDTPADWNENTPFNPGAGALASYAIQALDVEPATLDKRAVEGHYMDTLPTWITSAFSIETSGFVNASLLSTYTGINSFWGEDSNNIYLRTKFAGNTVTFIYNMFERVSTIPIPASDLDYDPINTNSQVVETTWTFPDSDKIEVGDIIAISNQRYNIQTGSTVGAAVNGSFVVTAAVRFNG